MRSSKPEFDNLFGDEEDITDILWELHEASERHTSGYGSLFMKALEIIKRLDQRTSEQESQMDDLQERIEELETEASHE